MFTTTQHGAGVLISPAMSGKLIQLMKELNKAPASQLGLVIDYLQKEVTEEMQKNPPVIVCKSQSVELSK